MRIHTKWLRSTLEQIPPLAEAIFVTTAAHEDGTRVEAPYAVIHPTDGSDEVTRLSGPASEQNPRWIIHGVGTTADQAAWVGEQVKKKLIVGGLGITPVITGERPSRMWLTSNVPIQVDRDVTPLLCIHITECGFSTEPA